MKVEIYGMKLHDEVGCEDLQILRVPGGWLYQTKTGTAFVPMCNEFNE